MVCFGRNGPDCDWIPDNDIRVRSDSYATFPRIQVEYFCSVRTSDSHKCGRIENTGVHTLFPDDGHSVFYTIHSVGNFSKIVLAQFLLGLVERTVVTAGYLKNAPILENHVETLKTFSTVQYIVKAF